MVDREDVAVDDLVLVGSSVRVAHLSLLGHIAMWHYVACLSSTYWAGGSNMGLVEHAGQSAANARFDLRAVSCDLDFSIGIPWIAQSSGPVERQSLR